MKAHAPGKLILSGEHAVVYGCPAIVTAVHRRATADVRMIQSNAQPVSEPALCVTAPDVLGVGRIPLHALPDLYETLHQRHAEFLNGDRDINQILSTDLDLVYYAVAMILAKRSPVADGAGIQIDLSTDIPIGCGMGSSAAILAATLAATAPAVGLPPPSPQTLYEWTWAAERLQHGRPSGVDPYIVTHGGCIRFQSGTATPLPVSPNAAVPGQPRGHWVMTGTPAVTTGECVAEVGRRFSATDPIWNDFTACTDAFEAAWLAGDRPALQAAIRANHRLLCRIGVVPAPVQAFIQAVEDGGGSAKICGAGATAGPRAGVVMVDGMAPNAVDALCQPRGYRSEPAEIAAAPTAR